MSTEKTDYSGISPVFHLLMFTLHDSNGHCKRLSFSTYYLIKWSPVQVLPLPGHIDEWFTATPTSLMV